VQLRDESQPSLDSRVPDRQIAHSQTALALPPASICRLVFGYTEPFVCEPSTSICAPRGRDAAVGLGLRWRFQQPVRLIVLNFFCLGFVYTLSGSGSNHLAVQGYGARYG